MASEKPRTPEQQLREMQRALEAMPPEDRPEVPPLPEQEPARQAEPGEPAEQGDDGGEDEGDRDMSGESTNQLLARILAAVERIPRDVVDELTG